MDKNYYLALDVFESRKIKNIYILDFKRKRMYNGYLNLISESYDYLPFSDPQQINKTTTFRFDYVYPINNDCLDKIMNSSFKKHFFKRNFNDVMIEFDLLEWII